MDTRSNVVRLEERKVRKGLNLREGIFGAQPGVSVLARDLLASVSFLNFLHEVVPGGFCHLRSGWDTVNASGVMDLWRAGARAPPVRAAISEVLRNVMIWWWEMLERRPIKAIQFSEPGGFVWRARLPRLRDLALSMGEASVVTICTDASGSHGCIEKSLNLPAPKPHRLSPTPTQHRKTKGGKAEKTKLAQQKRD